MVPSNVLTSIVLFLGLAIAAPTEPASEQVQNVARQELGERTCIGGGISCEYADGSRCARLCDAKTLTCSCPNGHWDDNVYHDIYSGASCIFAGTALGRHSCGE